MARRDQIVTPDAWSRHGEALVCGHPEWVVWSGIPGEESNVKVHHFGQNQVRAQWRSAKKPSAYRVKPSCDRYDLCGGCPHMHLNAVGQAKAKGALIRDALASEGLNSIRPEPLVPSPTLLGYRHLVKLQAGFSEHGRPRIGAPSRGTHKVVTIPKCGVITDELRHVIASIIRLFVEMKIRPWSPGRGGLLRHVVCRQSAHTGEIMVTLVASHRPQVLDDFAEQLSGRSPGIMGIHVHLNQELGNAIFHRDEAGKIGTSMLLGKMTISDRLADVDYQIGPGDFFQTNPAVADLLYRDVLDKAGVDEGKALVDLYCGVGGFALAAAKRSGWALGVEGVWGAVQRARQTASSEGIPAEFVHGVVEDVLAGLPRRLGKRQPVVVVNPARRGLEKEVALGIVELNPQKVLYVSCNPGAMARDLASFVDRGWQIDSLTPYDMFPNTPHIETVAELSPPGGVPEGADAGRAPRRKVVRK